MRLGRLLLIFILSLAFSGSALAWPSFVSDPAQKIESDRLQNCEYESDPVQSQEGEDSEEEEEPDCE